MSVLDTSREVLERESEITFFIASGPGGQHRHRNATGVRLVHRPSGIVVMATERRSQAANLDVAYDRLARRLEAASAVDAPRVPTRPSRSARVERRDMKRWGGVAFAVFGSVFRPDFGGDSDIDVLLTFREGVRYTPFALVRMSDELEATFGRSVDVLDRHAVEQSQNYLRRVTILNSAKVIYAE